MHCNLRSTFKPFFKPLFMGSGLAVLTLGSGLSAQESDSRPEQLIVTSTRLPRAINEVAGTITLITADDISREVANDLDDLVRYQPGLTMNSSNRGGNQGFVIRGIGGNRVLTVVDGIRSNDIYAAGPSSYGRDSFEIDDLKAVEVVRGPASVLYGADAMGGAVVLRTKDPEDYLAGDESSFLGVRSTAASADEQVKLGVTGVQRIGAVSTLLQVTRREFEEAEVNGPGRLNPQNGESNNLLLRSSWQVSDTQQLLFTLDAFREQLGVRLDTDIGRRVTESFGRDETDRTRAGFEYRWEAGLAAFDELDFSLQHQRTDALQHTEQVRTSFSFIDPRDPASFGGTEARRSTDFEFNQQTTRLGLNLSKAFTTRSLRHNLVYGLNHEITDTERPRNRCETALATGEATCSIAAFPNAPTEDFPNKTFPDTETLRQGIYIQDEILIGSTGLTLIPGVRYDRYEMNPSFDPGLDGTGFIENFGFRVTPIDVSNTTFNLGLLYDFSDQISLFAQYAEGYRPPNFDESNQAFVNLGFGYASVPNPELRPESSEGVEFGVRGSSEDAFFSISYYDNSYEDFIEGRFVGIENGIRLFQDRNVGEARIRGAEATGAWFLNERWTLRGSLAYARGDNEAADVPLDSVDPLTGVVGLRFNGANGRWGGEALVTAVAAKDRVSSDELATADSYALLDLLGHYRLTDSSTLRIGVFNLFDEQYARWTNIQGLEAADSEAIARSRQPGRNFRLAWDFAF